MKSSVTGGQSDVVNKVNLLVATAQRIEGHVGGEGYSMLSGINLP